MKKLLLIFLFGSLVACTSQDDALPSRSAADSYTRDACTKWWLLVDAWIPYLDAGPQEAADYAPTALVRLLEITAIASKSTNADVFATFDDLSTAAEAGDLDGMNRGVERAGRVCSLNGIYPPPK